MKNKQEVYEKLDYTTENLLYYLYHQNYYKFIGMDLSKQANTTIPEQINFLEN